MLENRRRLSASFWDSFGTLTSSTWEVVPRRGVFYQNIFWADRYRSFFLQVFLARLKVRSVPFLAKTIRTSYTRLAEYFWQSNSLWLSSWVANYGQQFSCLRWWKRCLFGIFTQVFPLRGFSWGLCFSFLFFGSFFLFYCACWFFRYFLLFILGSGWYWKNWLAQSGGLV